MTAYGWNHVCFGLGAGLIAASIVVGFGFHVWQTGRPPGLPLNPLALGDERGAAGDLDTALREVRMALRIYPNDAGVARRLAELLVATGPLEDELEAWRDVIRLSPDMMAPHLALGRAELVAGDAEQAANAFRSALDLAPDSLQARAGLAESLLRAGRAAESVPFFEAARQLAPDDGALQGRTGLAYAATGRLEEGAALLRESVRRTGDPLATENLRRVEAELEAERAGDEAPR